MNLNPKKVIIFIVCQFMLFFHMSFAQSQESKKKLQIFVDGKKYQTIGEYKQDRLMKLKEKNSKRSSYLKKKVVAQDNEVSPEVSPSDQENDLTIDADKKDIDDLKEFLKDIYLREQASSLEAGQSSQLDEERMKKLIKEALKEIIGENQKSMDSHATQKNDLPNTQTLNDILPPSRRMYENKDFFESSLPAESEQPSEYDNPPRKTYRKSMRDLKSILEFKN